MKKTLGTLAIASMFVLLCANAFAGYEYFWFQVVDDQGDVVTDLTSVTVYTAGTSTEATLYDSRNGTSTGVDNPIVSFTDGKVGFWGNKSSYDVKVEKTDRPILKINGLTAYQHSFNSILSNFDTHKNVVHQLWLAPAAISTTGCTGMSLFDTTVYYSNTVTVSAVATQPAYARNITWGCTNYLAGITSANPGNTVYLIVRGLDANGNSVTDNIQAGTTTVTTSPNSGVGVVAFSYVDTILFSTGFIKDLGHLVDTSTFFYIGWGDKLGLKNQPYGDTVFKVIENTADIRPTTAGIVNGTYNTYDPYTACNGTLNVEIWYLPADKEVIIE